MRSEARPAKPSRRKLRAWLATGGLALVGGGLVWVAVGHKRARVPSHVAVNTRGAPPGVEASASAFVDNALCLDCHVEQATLWRTSHHAQAMAQATPASVRGSFDDAVITHDGVTSRFFRRGDGLFVRTDGPDGTLAEFRVRYTLGVEPLQQYLVELPGGHLAALPFAWDVPRGHWFHLSPEESLHAGDALHWTGRYQIANSMCIACHTTGFEKRYDADTDHFDSRWAEINVSCQACHGPGGRHVAWAEQRGTRGAAAPAQDTGLVVSLREATAQREVETCAPCHSRRSELTAQAVAGAPRLDHYLPARLEPGLYHADGQQLDEVYVDGSYRQSKMYQVGVRCSDCHDPHSGRLARPGNATCVRCHSPEGDPRFPSARGTFDAPSHHFHPRGAECVGCHMPRKVYMQIQARPDHAVRVPRPDLSVKLGTPNACNMCHSERSAEWAVARVAAWYGEGRRKEPHYGEAFEAARRQRPDAPLALGRIVSDAQYPPFVRASAVLALTAYERAELEAKARAASDADAEVRAAAAASLESASAPVRVRVLSPLLRDPVRAVRIAAARSASSLPRGEMDESMRSAFDAALDELVAAETASLDMPGAQLNLGVVYENLGRLGLAEAHYLRALALDRDFVPARANLARMYDAGGRPADAERLLREGLARTPTLFELRHSLGLVLAEQGRMPEAASALLEAAEGLPGHAKVRYNLGLALQQLGQREPAEAALLEAYRLDARDPATPFALAVFYARAGRRDDALDWAQKVLALAPDDAAAARLVASLRAADP